MSFDAIPAELRERRQWVVWALEKRDGKGTKVPYVARPPLNRGSSGTGRKWAASSTDPSTWRSFVEAVFVARDDGFDGVGFVFTENDPYCGVDLDSGLPEFDRAAIALKLASYTEESVSGNGWHVIVKASLNGRRRRSGPFEVYAAGRYFVFTGRHVLGTPTTIEERQAELEAVLAEFLPKSPPQNAKTESVRAQPVDLDDQDLLERMLGSKQGERIQRLWDGDWSGYSSQSEADQALCNYLAFWTNRDAPRMDSLFRSSGLLRTKWTDREDYRERTIETAIAATPEGYRAGFELGASQVRPSGDAPSSNTPVAEPESAGASLRPPYKGTQDGTHLQSTASVDALRVVEASRFAAVAEASAEPLLGDVQNTVLAAGGDAAWYGDGGAGKTTLGLDRACHLCAGREWLGLPVPRPLRALWIENEGPRGKFREKLRAKLAAWDGPSLEGRLHVLEHPWSLFSFSDEGHRRELVERIRELGIDVVFAGPVQRLGVEGGGTPAEVQAFVSLLALARIELDRPLAYDLIHHENKSGDVSGAWEGVTDTLAHVQARGNGHTAVVWRKVRWAPELHGKIWKLNWRDGERFELDETPETTDDEIEDKLLELVGVQPGRSWNAYDELLAGKAKRKRVVRDRLLAEALLVNVGSAKAMRLFLPGHVDDSPSEQTTFEDAA